jgi:hypothetical protein
MTKYAIHGLLNLQYSKTWIVDAYVGIDGTGHDKGCLHARISVPR